MFLTIWEKRRMALIPIRWNIIPKWVVDGGLLNLSRISTTPRTTWHTARLWFYARLDLKFMWLTRTVSWCAASTSWTWLAITTFVTLRGDFWTTGCLPPRPLNCFFHCARFSFQTPVHVWFLPHTIAGAVLYLTNTRFPDINLATTPPWWEAFGASLEDMEIICMQITELYSVDFDAILRLPGTTAELSAHLARLQSSHGVSTAINWTFAINEGRTSSHHHLLVILIIKINDFPAVYGVATDSAISKTLKPSNLSHTVVHPHEHTQFNSKPRCEVRGGCFWRDTSVSFLGIIFSRRSREILFFKKLVRF